MITRVVKMVMQADEGGKFEEIFASVNAKIRSTAGCISVELLKDPANCCVYFTISQWESENDLENYRSSDLFKQTWMQVKPLFAEKAEAWSLVNVITGK